MTSLNAWHSGAWRVGRVVSAWHSGAWRTAKGVWAWHSGAWQKVFSGIVITGVPTSFTSDINVVQFQPPGNSGAPAHTITFTITGGSAPYTYTLSKISGGSEFNVNNAGPASYSSPSSLVSCNNSAAVLETGVFRLTVTDSGGATSFVDTTLGAQGV